MSRLSGIIRFRQWELDEKRRALAALEEQRQQFLDMLDALDAELEAEKRQAGGEVGALVFGAFMEGIRQREAIVRERLVRKDEEIERQRDQVAAAFNELKTFETAAKREAIREAKRLAGIEQSLLDEQGLERHRRSTENDL